MKEVHIEIVLSQRTLVRLIILLLALIALYFHVPAFHVGAIGLILTLLTTIKRRRKK